LSGWTIGQFTRPLPLCHPERSEGPRRWFAISESRTVIVVRDCLRAISLSAVKRRPSLCDFVPQSGVPRFAGDDGKKTAQCYFEPTSRAIGSSTRQTHCRIVILNEVKDPAYMRRITQTLLSDHETMGEVPRFARDDRKKVAQRYFEPTSRAIGSSTRQTFSARILCPAAFG
jgi:hypothetical protein